MGKELKTYQEYNGFKVGETYCLNDLWKQDGFTFLIEQSSYRPSKKSMGEGRILAICDTGFDFRSLGFKEEDYFLITGEWLEGFIMKSKGYATPGTID